MSGFTITGSMTFSGGFDIPFPIADQLTPTVEYLVAIQVQEAVASSSFATQTHMTLLAQQPAHQQ
jgi:hypothetical protein